MGEHAAQSTFRIETLAPLVQAVEQLSGRAYADNPPPFRVIVDHLRSATFAIADGAAPSNVEAGYVVRRMLRRAVRYGRELGIQENFCAALAGKVVARNMDAERNREMVKTFLKEMDAG